MENGLNSENKPTPSSQETEDKEKITQLVSLGGAVLLLLAGAALYAINHERNKRVLPTHDDIMAKAIATQVFALRGNIKSSYEYNGEKISSETVCLPLNAKNECQSVLIDFRKSSNKTTNTALVQKDGQNYVVTWPTREEVEALKATPKMPARDVK